MHFSFTDVYPGLVTLLDLKKVECEAIVRTQLILDRIQWRE
jgi:hypothetical protein